MIPNPDIEVLKTTFSPRCVAQHVSSDGTTYHFRSGATLVLMDIIDYSGWLYECGDMFHLTDTRGFKIHSVSRQEGGYWQLEGYVV